jgi:hypothetical protein
MWMQFMPIGVLSKSAISHLRILHSRRRIVSMRRKRGKADEMGGMVYTSWDLPIVVFHDFGRMRALKLAADAV